MQPAPAVACACVRGEEQDRAWCSQRSVERAVQESSTPGTAGGRPLLSAGLCNKGGSLKIDFEPQCRKGSETYRVGVYLSYTPCVWCPAGMGTCPKQRRRSPVMGALQGALVPVVATALTMDGSGYVGLRGALSSASQVAGLLRNSRPPPRPFGAVGHSPLAHARPTLSATPPPPYTQTKWHL